MSPHSQGPLLQRAPMPGSTHATVRTTAEKADVETAASSKADVERAASDKADGERAAEKANVEKIAAAADTQDEAKIAVARTRWRRLRLRTLRRSI